MNTDHEKERIRKGIVAYSHERSVLLRLLKKRGSFTEKDFDSWLILRETKRPGRCHRITGETLMLGLGVNFGMWALWMELLHCLIHLGEVRADTENGLVVYSGVK